MRIFHGGCHALPAVTFRATELLIGVFGYNRMSRKGLWRIFESWIVKTQMAGFASVYAAQFLTPSLPISESELNRFG
jgi:hypothetical protein